MQALLVAYTISVCVRRVCVCVTLGNHPPFCGSAFSLDADQPDYDMDSEDEACMLQLQKRMEIGAMQFEDMIERLEKGSGQQVGWHGMGIGLLVREKQQT